MKSNTNVKVNCLHATYGFGALTAPLAATYFSTTKHWSYHYLISVGLAVMNSIILALVFRGRRQEGDCSILSLSQVYTCKLTSILYYVLLVLLANAGQLVLHQTGGAQRGGNLYKEIFSMRAVHYMAIFALIYIGVEVTVGGLYTLHSRVDLFLIYIHGNFIGWIVTFIITERDGGPSAGYISSGFFGGLTLGRLSLIWVNKMVRYTLPSPRFLVVAHVAAVSVTS